MQRTHTIFLDWNLPLLPAVTQRLLAKADGDFIDLSHLLVIVPTVQSGRRLRETLALKSNGLFPPEIVTPDGLLEPMLRGQSIASESVVVAAWVSVLNSLDFRQFTTLFPVTPEPTVVWSHGMARRFVQLRNELGEAGLDFQQVARFNRKNGYEPERWQELAQLEMLYLKCLETLDFHDPKQLRRSIARKYQPPKTIERIILAATPDPQPLIIEALEQSVIEIPIEVWVYGTENTQFDHWGRPDTDYWNQRSLELEAWGVELQTVTTQKLAASFIAESVQEKAPESVLIGLADSTANPVVADALVQVNVPYYDPEGYPLKHGAIGQLTELLCELCNQSDIGIVRSLLGHPDIQSWLSVTASTNQLLQQLDQIFEDHLAPDLFALIYFATRSEKTIKLKEALRQLSQLADELSKTKNFARALAKQLQLIYAEKKIESTIESEIPWKERAEAIRNLLQQIAETEDLFPKLSKPFVRKILQHSLNNSRIYPIRPQQAHDLLGWLELLWNDAPHLILTGLNEGCVPESVVGDSFLPESLRKQIGLRTNAQRLARDAYLLEALCQRRNGENARIDFLIPQASQDQHPLRPSRLLFQSTEDQFLQRTRRLFQANGRMPKSHTRSAAWKLKPPPNIELPTSLPVSALKSYLQCPFRFFLRYLMNMRPVDVETRELSPAAFGSLFHDTVAMLKGDTIDPTTKPSSLIKKLHAIAKNMFEHRYGKRPSFALRLQQEALMEHIVAFAEHQCNDVLQNNSIHILNTEEPFELSLEGFILKGRIDRVDQCGNRLELIDYKTSNQPASPESAHIASVGKKAPPAHLPEDAFFEQGNKCYRWTNLQLPLYRLAKDSNHEKDIAIAYFNLGQTTEKSGIARWETFTLDLQNSAKACAAAVLRQIRSGIFWPPSQTVYEPYDDFIKLFPDGIENSVEAEAFANYQFEKDE